MSEKPLVSVLPSGALRWFLRLPIWLYRLRLGGLLGNRFVVIHHVGRKTGQVHRAFVEVVELDQHEGVIYVASGWGRKSQWYQNLMATPDVSVQLGWRTLPVTAATVDPREGAHVLLRYRQAHPPGRAAVKQADGRRDGHGHAGRPARHRRDICPDRRAAPVLTPGWVASWGSNRIRIPRP